MVKNRFKMVKFITKESINNTLADIYAADTKPYSIEISLTYDF